MLRGPSVHRRYLGERGIVLHSVNGSGGTTFKKRRRQCSLVVTDTVTDRIPLKKVTKNHQPPLYLFFRSSELWPYINGNIIMV